MFIIQERFNNKSLIWSAENYIIYSTNNHIKFSIINSENGILKCIENLIYLL
jgi:hypothetical protein